MRATTLLTVKPLCPNTLPLHKLHVAKDVEGTATPAVVRGQVERSAKAPQEHDTEKVRLNPSQVTRGCCCQNLVNGPALVFVQKSDNIAERPLNSGYCLMLPP